MSLRLTKLEHDLRAKWSPLQQPQSSTVALYITQKSIQSIKTYFCRQTNFFLNAWARVESLTKCTLRQGRVTHQVFGNLTEKCGPARNRSRFRQSALALGKVGYPGRDKVSRQVCWFCLKKMILESWRCRWGTYLENNPVLKRIAISSHSLEKFWHWDCLSRWKLSVRWVVLQKTISQSCRFKTALVPQHREDGRQRIQEAGVQVGGDEHRNHRRTTRDRSQFCHMAARPQAVQRVSLHNFRSFELRTEIWIEEKNLTGIFRVLPSWSIPIATPRVYILLTTLPLLIR